MRLHGKKCGDWSCGADYIYGEEGRGSYHMPASPHHIQRVSLMIAIERFRGGGHLPFIGRGRELDRLLAFWAEAEEEGLRSALLIAEAGCGKSRTIDELIP